MTVPCQALFETIDRLNPEFIQHWITVCSIESPTDCKEGVDRVGQFFLDFAQKHGWQIEILEQAIAGNCICITMNPDAPEAPVTLSGHMDTVHPIGSFGNPPVRWDETNLYAPGVMDCKGGLVAALLAMTALELCEFRRRPVRLLLQSDEESNSIHSRKETIQYICRKAADSVAFLNCESIHGNTAVLYRRGIVRFRFSLHGKAIHASRCPEGSSAIAEAAHKILALEEWKDLSGITCNVGLIQGGSSENTVPEDCAFSAEFRFNTNREMADAERIVQKIAAETHIPGVVCSVTKTVSRCAMEPQERNYALLDTMNRIYTENGLPTLSARQSLGGSDAAEVTKSGIPCVDSIGVAGDFIHTRNEYAVLDSLAQAAKRMASVIFCI